ncbi:MAG TPA: hypothetical protein DDX71_02595 [Ruminococcus sp.]|nr:hypothetical protein [Ruminococcus sp.]
MPLQRVREAESRTGDSFANGPLRAQSADAGKTATCRHTLVVRDMLVSCKSAQMRSAFFRRRCESRWHREYMQTADSSLTVHDYSSQGGFLFCPSAEEGGILPCRSP